MRSLTLEASQSPKLAFLGKPDCRAARADRGLLARVVRLEHQESHQTFLVAFKDAAHRVLFNGVGKMVEK